MGVLIKTVPCFIFALLFVSCNDLKVADSQINKWTEQIVTFNANHYKIAHSNINCDSVPPLPPDFFNGKKHLTYEDWVYDIYFKYRIDLYRKIEIPEKSLIDEFYNGMNFSISVKTDKSRYYYSGSRTIEGFKFDKKNKSKTEISIDEQISQTQMGVINKPDIPECDISKILTTSYYDGSRFIVLSVTVI